MDIKRDPPKKTKKIIAYGAGLVAIVAVSIGISKLKPAAPPVERGTLWIDTVKRGSMTRDVNAPGTLDAGQPAQHHGAHQRPRRGAPGQAGHQRHDEHGARRHEQPRRRHQAADRTSRRSTPPIGQLAQLKTNLHQQILGQQGVVANTRTTYNNAIRTRLGATTRSPSDS